MGPRRFDEIAITVAGGGHSRRAALCTVGGSLLGAALGAAGPASGDGVAKGCFIAGRRCRHARQCCSGRCRRGWCAACPNGERECGRACVRTATDPKHCGGCDRRCAAGQPCVGGACRCSGTGCTGCCDGAACQPGTTDQRCGTNGIACLACGSGQRCAGGACVCDDQSCATGCCAGTTCDPGTADGACASGGETCRDCAAEGLACDGSGQCVCTAASCPGCCDGGTCRPGTTDQRCGANGEACAACPAGQRCDNGVCVCDGQSCPRGCCAGGASGTCIAPSHGQCGWNGEACVDCGECFACTADGRCVPGSDGNCCSTGRCIDRECGPVVVSLADCGGRCSPTGSPYRIGICGFDVTCSDCDDCVALGCPGGAQQVSGPVTRVFCVTGPSAGDCDAGTPCPAGTECFGSRGCFTICTGV